MRYSRGSRATHDPHRVIAALLQRAGGYALAAWGLTAVGQQAPPPDPVPLSVPPSAAPAPAEAVPGAVLPTNDGALPSPGTVPGANPQGVIVPGALPPTGVPPAGMPSIGTPPPGRLPPGNPALQSGATIPPEPTPLPPSAPSVALQPGSPAAQGGVLSPLLSAPILEPGQASFEHGLPAALLSPGQGLQLGRFRFHGGLSTGLTYDDNVRASATDRRDDFIWTISPYGAASTEGPNARTLNLAYRPSFLFYQDETDLNSINHFANFDLRWPFNRLTLGLSEDIAVASAIVRDVGDRTMQRTYGTQVSANYELGHVTSLAGSVRYDIWDYDKPLVDSQQWTEQAWFDYQFRPWLSAGLGATFAQVDVQDSPSQTSEGPALRFTYNPLPRLNLSGSVGLEFRQYDSDVSSTTEPVFRFAGVYKIRDGTTASIEAHRAEQASGLIAGANYLDTGFSAGLSQVFLRRFVGTLAGGYTTADYHATEAGVSTQRSDNYYFLRTSLGYTLAEQWGLGVFYERRENESSTNYSFDQNVVGVQASWSF